MKSVSIIGPGRVGGALALALSEKGFQIENLYTKHKEKTLELAGHLEQNPSIRSLQEDSGPVGGIIFITTQDAEIENVVRELSGKEFLQPVYFFHTSGSLSSEILKDLKRNDALVGSIHPLVSVSDPFLGGKRFRDAYFCLEGDAEAVRLAERIVRDLGGKPFSIETKYKALYHASAVTACGHLVALIDVSLEMLEKCGLETLKAKKILMPLISSTIDNIGEQNLSAALTGTFSRGDLKTLKKHIKIINDNFTNEILRIYLLLGERSLKLAGEQGVDRKKLEKMAGEISLAKKNLK